MLDSKIKPNFGKSEIKSGKTFKKEYVTNMDYLAGQLDDVKDSAVIYDGNSMPPALLNIRNI